MKIATITCQHVYNYGATLQAYALQHYLESLGHDVEIISYLPTYKHRYDLHHISKNRKAYKLFFWCKPILNKFAEHYNKKILTTIGRKPVFDAFDKDYLHLTATPYYNVDELRVNPPAADVYIAGSDQIWNTDGQNGRDPAYYLDFGTAKKISYAASFAVSEVADEWKPFVKQQLSHFSAISVREKTGLKILENLGYSGENVVDPVFLLSAEEWIKALNLKPVKKDYIFLYDFLHNNDAMRTYALQLKQQTGLPIISINDLDTTDYADVNINDAGPREFLQYILGARYVICESFHATAFSLIFHKQFATWPLATQKNSSRMTDLLSLVSLSSRFHSQELKQIQTDINWEYIDTKLSDSAQKSKFFLLQSFDSKN